jgi:hypothetical protein
MLQLQQIGTRRRQKGQPSPKPEDAALERWAPIDASSMDFGFLLYTAGVLVVVATFAVTVEQPSSSTTTIQGVCVCVPERKQALQGGKEETGVVGGCLVVALCSFFLLCFWVGSIRPFVHRLGSLDQSSFMHADVDSLLPLNT